MDADPNLLVSPNNAGVVAVIVALVQVARLSAPEWFRTRRGQRVLPVMPASLGLIAGLLGFLDGGSTPLVTWQSKVMVGLLTGFAAGQLFKIGATSILPGARLIPPDGAPPPSEAGAPADEQTPPADEQTPPADEQTPPADAPAPAPVAPAPVAPAPTATATATVTVTAAGRP